MYSTLKVLAASSLFLLAKAQTPAQNPNSATTFTFSLASTNPTAVPIQSIVSTAPSAPVKSIQSTPTAGAVPTGISGAPPLPDISTINPANYPTLDRIVNDTTSPFFLQWKKDVENSGIKIPDFAPTTQMASCAANPQAAQDPNRCWWTCSGCTRDTDVTTCPDKMSWGLTFDDGPSDYTPDLLTYLDEKKLKATMFVTGSRVISNPNTLRAEYMSGHQIAIHTWSHFPLTTMTNDQIIAELGWTKKVIKDVLGVTPNMMRPPFGDFDDRVRAICTAMGLIPVMWTRISPTATFDTEDFNIHGGSSSVQRVLSNWNSIMTNVSSRNDGFVTLQHDLFQQAVQVNTGYILPDALAHQPPFKITPVAECLHRGVGDAYIETNDNKTYPPPNQGGKPSTPGGNSNQGGGTGSGNGASGLRTGFEIVAAVALLAGASIL